jgi:hypothetical protein
MASIFDMQPLEEGGPIARGGFTYQDHVAAAYCLEMFRKGSMLAVWCETQDDILLEKTVNGQRITELIQVKSDALDQLWSIVKLCERETRKKIKVVGSSIVEKQLAKDRGDETSHFRLVTLLDINAELSILKKASEQRDQVELGALIAKFKQRLGSYASPKGNGADYWIRNMQWDVRESAQALENSNLLALEQYLTDELGLPLLLHHKRELYGSLVDVVRRLAGGRWADGPKQKRITREELLQWIAEAASRFPTALRPQQAQELVSLERESIGRCEARWQVLGVSPDVAKNLATDPSVGAASVELLGSLERPFSLLVGDLGSGKPNIGIASFTLEDDMYFQPREALRRSGLPSDHIRPVVDGEAVRDWQVGDCTTVVWPYDSDFGPIGTELSQPVLRYLWNARTSLVNSIMFGDETKVEAGLAWYEFGRLTAHRLRTPLSITFAFVSTHNHFALDVGGKVFNRTAPVIKLPLEATVEQHTTLLGALNSSTGSFWLRQICAPKGGSGIGRGIQNEAWEGRLTFNATQIANFPIPARQPTQLPAALVKASTALQAQLPAATLASWGGPESGELRPWLASARDLATRQRHQLIAWQEELDWQIYESFGLVEAAPPSAAAEATAGQVSLPEGAAVDAIPAEGIELGQRAFEIVLARRMAAGEAQSTWFERHGSTPITEVPRHWPAAYRELVERRIRRIADDPNIRLIEQPEYKRRWNTEPWDEQQERALRQWLLNRLEGYFFDSDRMLEITADDADKKASAESIREIRGSFIGGQRPALISTNQLAEVVQADAAFLKVAEVYVGAAGFSVPKLVRELVESESVPFLPFQRYKESGLRKRQDWERTWDLQRKEDAIEAEVRGQKSEVGGRKSEVGEEQIKALIKKRQKEEIGEIPVPPKYASANFKSSTFWRLRGKLDVPKERWINYAGVEREGDPSTVIAWAGWNHLQQAQALAEYYITAKDTWGWTPERLTLLLAGLADLLPWLKQWHNELNPEYGMGLGEYFAGFLDEEYRKNGTTVESVDGMRLGEES